MQYLSFGKHTYCDVIFKFKIIIKLEIIIIVVNDADIIKLF